MLQKRKINFFETLCAWIRNQNIWWSKIIPIISQSSLRQSLLMNKFKRKNDEAKQWWDSFTNRLSVRVSSPTTGTRLSSWNGSLSCSYQILILDINLKIIGICILYYQVVELLKVFVVFKLAEHAWPSFIVEWPFWRNKFRCASIDCHVKSGLILREVSLRLSWIFSFRLSYILSCRLSYICQRHCHK